MIQHIYLKYTEPTIKNFDYLTITGEPFNGHIKLCYERLDYETIMGAQVPSSIVETFEYEQKIKTEDFELSKFVIEPECGFSFDPAYCLSLCHKVCNCDSDSIPTLEISFI